jgi:hypothetical protein
MEARRDAPRRRGDAALRKSLRVVTASTGARETALLATREKKRRTRESRPPLRVTLFLLAHNEQEAS